MHKRKCRTVGSSYNRLCDVAVMSNLATPTV